MPITEIDMPERSHFPISASRLIVIAGAILCAVVAAMLFLIAAVLAVAWPSIAAEALAKGLEAKLDDVQPWASLLLATAGVLVALAARMFHRLKLILDSVAAGDPFTADNSRRLRHIGWLIILMQLLGWLAGWFGTRLPPDVDLGEGFGFSFTSLLAALLAFVVAQLFEQARGLRDELEGTV
jgi:hypothetical protein